MEQKHLLKAINECKKGDKEAFRHLMLEYADYIFTLAFRILRNEEDSKDVVQETFIKLWQNIHKYDEKIKLSTWMYKICTNLCFDKLKSKKRKPEIFDIEFDKNFHLLTSDSHSESLDNRQLAAIIEQMAEGLTPKQQLVFVLKDIQGLDSTEIVKVTGLDKGQIKSNLYYARREIRKKLMKIGYEVR